MDYDYKTLKKIAKSGGTVGRWKGKLVFSANKRKLNDKQAGVFYILYNDNNKLVRKVNDEWECYGEVCKDGTINEYDFPSKYKLMEVSMNYGVKQEARTVAVYNPGYSVNEKPMGDMKIEMDVDMTLRKAREMSVADLLKGFNYGLD